MQKNKAGQERWQQPMTTTAPAEDCQQTIQPIQTTDDHVGPDWDVESFSTVLLGYVGFGLFNKWFIFLGKPMDQHPSICYETGRRKKRTAPACEYCVYAGTSGGREWRIEPYKRRVLKSPREELRTSFQRHRSVRASPFCLSSLDDGSFPTGRNAVENTRREDGRGGLVTHSKAAYTCTKGMTSLERLHPISAMSTDAGFVRAERERRR